MDVLFILGGVQALFFTALMMVKKGKMAADKVLLSWMVIIAMHLIGYYLISRSGYQGHPHLYLLLLPLPLVQGAMLILYVHTLIKQRIDRLLFLTFLPALTYYLYLSPSLFSSSKDLRAFFEEILPDNIPPAAIFFDALVSVSGVVFVIWSLVLLYHHRRRMAGRFSYTDDLDLSWLLNIILGMAFIWTVVIGIDIMGTRLPSYLTGTDLIFTAVVLFVFAIGFYGTRQGEIFAEQPSKLFSKARIKYERSSLSAENMEEIFQKLTSHMESERPYLESKLSLQNLASQLDLPPHHLSQVINDKCGQNFYHFVNQYRVEAFKQKLENGETSHLTLLALAYDCGFNSKSSFNAVFKKLTGFTPSQYQKSALAAQS